VRFPVADEEVKVVRAIALRQEGGIGGCLGTKGYCEDCNEDNEGGDCFYFHRKVSLSQNEQPNKIVFR
jgi:hypothetical protein